MSTADVPWTAAEFKQELLALEHSYHIHHPFQKAMNSGLLDKAQIQGWVANRFYYQVMIPRKDAAILANCPDRQFRQRWIQRIIDHDGSPDHPGGIEAWLRLAHSCGLSREKVSSGELVLPGVRFAVDAYYNFAKQSPWQEAVCSSLTELFAPVIHKQRLDNWPKHYPWIDQAGLKYFQDRIKLAQRDVEHGLEVTLNYFNTQALQQRAIDIVKFKLSVLWSMLDAIAVAYHFPLAAGSNKKIKIAPAYKLAYEDSLKCFVLLYPEGMVKLNESAAEVLQLCNGTKNEEEIIQHLEKKFQDPSVRNDVTQLIGEAYAKGWIQKH